MHLLKWLWPPDSMIQLIHYRPAYVNEVLYIDCCEYTIFITQVNAKGCMTFNGVNVSYSRFSRLSLRVPTIGILIHLGLSTLQEAFSEYVENLSP